MGENDILSRLESKRRSNYRDWLRAMLRPLGLEVTEAYAIYRASRGNDNNYDNNSNTASYKVLFAD